MRATLFSKILMTLVATGILISESQADVSARLSRGTLTLTGDSFGDAVELGGTAEPDTIQVSINHGPFVQYVGVANIRIDMKTGADEVALNFIGISGNLDVNMGGDLGDRCLVFDSLIGGNYTNQGLSETIAFGMMVGGNMTLKADMAFDVDANGYTMIVVGVSVDGRTRLEGGRSSDDDLIVEECEFASDLVVNLGGGADDARLDTIQIGRNLTTDGGSGFDILNRARLLIGGRNNSRRFEHMTDFG